ncbi:hypothetical protein PVK06_039674 [Gossypium arboreum]|uniref:Uncharacterized protein n=1 Tax=Gossypium arboreum TaxID=29729 RepID=A0ABR0N3J0_GOSAR|nr:hypothetical protein PVK06_039674 [Gossypium arboreum]
MWPHNSFDELGLILRGAIEKPVNFFYHFYKINLCPFALVEYLQGEAGRQNVNMLTTSTDHRVVTDAGINHSSGDSLSKTDSISREINKAMKIDFLISGACKRRKTIDGAMCINFVSEEEGNRYSSTALHVSHFVPIFGKVLVGCHGGSFSWHRDLSAQEYPYNHDDVGGCNFYLESPNMPVRSFVLANCVGGCSFSPTSPSVTVGSFVLANYVGGCDSSPASLNMTARSFVLANCVRGCGFSPVSLNMTSRSFALANCVGSCGSSPASLNMTTRNFALANCVEGCGFSPASLNMT